MASIQLGPNRHNSGDNLYLAPTGHLHARPRQIEVLEERNRALVTALTTALERIRTLTEQLMEERRR